MSTNWGRKAVPLLVVAVTALTVTGAAQAKPRAIKLSTSTDLTVVALAPNGNAAEVSGLGDLSISPPASRVTLHIISDEGQYLGPVVVGKRSGKAVMGVKAGSALGTLKLRKGYATPSSAANLRLDKSVLAKATKAGIPIGAGKQGLVKTPANGRPGEGRDEDLDGIPGSFDVDDDGDLVLDSVEGDGSGGEDPSNGSDSSENTGPTEGTTGGSFRVFSNLKLDLARTVNANVATVSTPQIDAALASAQTLAFQVIRGDRTSLNCYGRTYCTLGGTGRSLASGTAFPNPGNVDANGFGIMTVGSTGDFQLVTGATTAAISAGDTFMENVYTGTRVDHVPGVLNFYFVSTPAVTEVSSGSSDSVEVSYPTAEGSPGTASNPFSVRGSGDAVVKLTFWRPQREPVAGAEGPGYIDAGRLQYVVDVPNGPGGTSAGPGMCSSNSYAPDDDELRVSGNSVVDQAPDRPADPSNELTLNVNLTKCLATKGLTWSTGQSLSLDIMAMTSNGDNAAQKLYLKRA